MPEGDSIYRAARTLHELSPRAVPGTARRGRPAEAWTGEGLGPAGGIRSTVAKTRAASDAASPSGTPSSSTSGSPSSTPSE